MLAGSTHADDREPREFVDLLLDHPVTIERLPRRHAGGTGREEKGYGPPEDEAPPEGARAAQEDLVKGKDLSSLKGAENEARRARQARECGRPISGPTDALCPGDAPLCQRPVEVRWLGGDTRREAASGVTGVCDAVLCHC